MAKYKGKKVKLYKADYERHAQNKHREGDLPSWWEQMPNKAKQLYLKMHPHTRLHYITREIPTAVGIAEHHIKKVGKSVVHIGKQAVLRVKDLHKVAKASKDFVHLLKEHASEEKAATVLEHKLPEQHKITLIDGMRKLAKHSKFSEDEKRKFLVTCSIAVGALGLAFAFPAIAATAAISLHTHAGNFHHWAQERADSLFGDHSDEEEEENLKLAQKLARRRRQLEKLREEEKAEQERLNKGLPLTPVVDRNSDEDVEEADKDDKTPPNLHKGEKLQPDEDGIREKLGEHRSLRDVMDEYDRQNNIPIPTKEHYVHRPLHEVLRSEATFTVVARSEKDYLVGFVNMLLEYLQDFHTFNQSKQDE
jgi:hypothetical protein